MTLRIVNGDLESLADQIRRTPRQVAPRPRPASRVRHGQHTVEHVQAERVRVTRTDQVRMTAPEAGARNRARSVTGKKLIPLRIRHDTSYRIAKYL